MRRRWLGRPVGSSPHTRGTRYCTNNECETFRFIPAYAGNEQTVRVARLTWPVHPRIRGERSQRAPRTLATSGSSPHTRGTIPAPPPPSTRSRFIPAYAGNAPFGGSSTGEKAVHPRIRGERTGGQTALPSIIGSSPHTRGTRFRQGCRFLCLRFIPAYAGNAASRCEMPATSSVHPRIRGERNNEIARVAPSIGSSPHTRGTLAEHHRYDAGRRFIPAYAGNAATGLGRCAPTAVHPRIRGERAANHYGDKKRGGSSPHTRGTRPSGVQNRPYKRFIPAYAGNARGPARQQTPPSVHPRIRGERSSSPASSGSYVGSSPHTRGTPSRPCSGVARMRFIPAYAGNAAGGPSGAGGGAVHPRIRGERTSSKLLIYRMKSEPSDSTKRSGC